MIFSTVEIQNARKDWLDNLSNVRRLSPHTISSYERDTRQFFLFLQKHLGKEIELRDLEKLTIIDFRSFLAMRHKLGTSARSQARMLASLRAFFLFLDRRGLAKVPAIAYVKNPKQKQLLPKALDANKAKNMLSKEFQDEKEPWVEARNIAILTLLYGCGLRLSEALAIKSGELLGSETTIRIVGKGNKTRILPILPIIHEAIAEYRKQCPYSLNLHEPLFRGVRGGPIHPGIVQRFVRDLRARMQLNKYTTPHALRHSFATHLLSNGADLRSIQQLLGHVNLSTTQIYAKVNAEQMKSLYDNLHPRA